MPESSPDNLHVLKHKPLSEGDQDMVDMLLTWVARIRDGEFRSCMLVGMTTDGLTVETAWQCFEGDSLKLLRHMLEHDITAQDRAGT
jgi:hypothetical protein